MEILLFMRFVPVVALFLQNFMIPGMVADNFEDQRNFFYPPYPNPGTAPPVSYTPPAPYHGGGGGGSTPPADGGNHPSGGSGHHGPPSGGNGGSGYHHSSPTTTVTPPTTPGTTPSPPHPFDPNSPPFTCTYWKNHPTLVWGLMGWWGTMSNAFGLANLPGYGAHMNLMQALSNTRTDGFGQLYREGTAALLNSMVHTKFPYTTNQVRDSFVGSLNSDKAAAAQAQLFKLANEEGRIKPRF